MIIVDYSQTIISNLMAELNGRKDVELEIPLLRHMVLNTLRSYNNRFKEDYGNMVIACDSKEKYWRKEYFQYYKSNRKKARDESGYDWNMIFNAISQIKNELKETFPYKVLEVPGAEADDIIATLCKWTQINSMEKVLIVSGDHDFFQLQKYKNIKQYSSLKNKFVKAERPPEHLVLEHIIKGDRGDGIPNVFSADDSIINGERQKPVSSKKLQEWLDNPTTLPTDDSFKRNFDRNKRLVDFSEIPKIIETQIINSFENYNQNDKSRILNYFIEHKMKQMVDYLEEF